MALAVMHTELGLTIMGIYGWLHESYSYHLGTVTDHYISERSIKSAGLDILDAQLPRLFLLSDFPWQLLLSYQVFFRRRKATDLGALVIKIIARGGIRHRMTIWNQLA
jgi:hypothetical protein